MPPLQPTAPTQPEIEPFSLFENAARLERTVEIYFDTIKSLPLFKNLPSFVLFDILRTAHVISYNKGALVSTPGETLTQFYVIIEGWAKIYKTSPEGDEAILLLLGKNDYITESGLTGSAIATTHAQAVEPLKLLALPLIQLREQIQKSSILAENMLACVSARAQSTRNQLEQLTLNKAPQRVGWFLLKQWIALAAGGSNFPLIFDKSLIAAYLNIRPETFSRILNQLKKDGFTTNQQVHMPNSRALCRYCDPTTTQICRFADTLHCPAKEEIDIR